MALGWNPWIDPWNGPAGAAPPNPWVDPYDPARGPYYNDPARGPYDPARGPYDPARGPYDPARGPYETARGDASGWNDPYEPTPFDEPGRRRFVYGPEPSSIWETPAAKDAPPAARGQVPAAAQPRTPRAVEQMRGVAGWNSPYDPSPPYGSGRGNRFVYGHQPSTIWELKDTAPPGTKAQAPPPAQQPPTPRAVEEVRGVAGWNSPYEPAPPYGYGRSNRFAYCHEPSSIWELKDTAPPPSAATPPPSAATAPPSATTSKQPSQPSPQIEKRAEEETPPARWRRQARPAAVQPTTPRAAEQPPTPRAVEQTRGVAGWNDPYAPSPPYGSARSKRFVYGHEPSSIWDLRR